MATAICVTGRSWCPSQNIAVFILKSAEIACKVFDFAIARVTNELRFQFVYFTFTCQYQRQYCMCSLSVVQKACLVYSDRGCT